MEEKFDVLNERGEFTGKIATREECHKKGLWHRAVYAFIIDDNKNILLQKRRQIKNYGPIYGMLVLVDMLIVESLEDKL